MLCHIASRVLAAVGLGLLLSAGYLVLWPASATPTVEVEGTARVFDELPADREEVVEFLVRNKTDHPLRVVGTTGFC
jgi:hypothetical protein